MISVIIPSYNSEKTIQRTIEALLNQKFPKNNYEIIIVDDGSSDQTVNVAREYPVKVFPLPHNGPAYARNFGAKKSRGNVILFTDSDCVPDKNWIKNMVEPFEDKEVVGVSGTYKTLNKESFIARFGGYEIDQRHEKMAKQKTIDFIGTFSAGYRKNIFLKFGGFDTRFKTSSGEDPELSYRIAKAGLKQVFKPSAFVYHPHPATLFKYLRQKYYRAVWRNLMYWDKHKDKVLSDSYTHKLLIPQVILSGLFSISILLWCLFSSILFSVASAIFLGGNLLIAFLFNLDIFLFIWKKEKNIALSVPFIFFARNIVVGIGVIAGLFKYFRKKF